MFCDCSATSVDRPLRRDYASHSLQNEKYQCSDTTRLTADRSVIEEVIVMTAPRGWKAFLSFPKC